MDLRFYTLEDRLNFGVGRQRHLRAGGWFDFERFCTLEDWLNFDANRRRHFRVCGWLDFERFCIFEGRRDSPLTGKGISGLTAGRGSSGSPRGRFRRRSTACFLLARRLYSDRTKVIRALKY